MAYTNENELRQALVAVRDRLAIKDKTEAQALVLSSTYPNCVYYTSDTHCIVIGGNIYGRGEQIVASNFAFLPASEPGPGHDPTFQDTTKIYVQPDSSNPGYFKLWWYLQSESTWINGGSFPLDIPLTAEDISYDLTPTPDLGEGDVQSAIEALDGKVEAVDARIDDEKVEFIKNVFPTKLDTDYTRVNRNAAGFDDGNLTAVSKGSTFYVTYTAEKVPKGSLIHLDAKHSKGSYYSSIGYATSSPVDWYAEHSTMVGFELTGQLYWESANSHDVYVILPEEGWLVFGWVNAYSYSYTRTIYSSDVIKDYYKKGVEDGSAMASIVGLGYNIWDYISGEIDLEGFEYGCEIYKQYLFKPTVSLNSKWKNSTKMVYFPKFDMTGLPNDRLSVYRICQGCTTLKIVPDLTFASGATYSFSETFQNCTNLLYFGNLENVSTTNISTMFAGCTKLIRVGRINTSGVTTWRSSTSNMMFYNCTALRRIEELDMTSSTQSAANWLVNSAKDNLRYVFLRNLGNASACTAANMSYFTNWGIPNASYADTSDARQSLIDTLLTYSFDRATAGYSACTVTLSANTKALLTDEEIEQITAKGYTIA